MISIHKKLSLAKESISVSQGLKSSCLALAVFMLAFVFIPYIVADVNAETAEVELDWTKVVLELDTGSNSGNVAFNNGGAITPDEAGKVATVSKTLTVNTTGKHFNVYLSMDSSVGNNNKLCYDFDASDPLKSACTHTGMGVNPVIENSGSPAALTGNDWGYALNDGETGFSSAGTYSNNSLSGDIISSTTTNSADLALYNAKWAAVPANTDLNSEESKTRGYWDPSASVVALSGSTLTEKLQSKLGADQTCSEQFQSKGNAGSGCYWGSKLSDDGNLTPLADVTNNANAAIPRSYMFEVLLRVGASGRGAEGRIDNVVSALRTLNSAGANIHAVPEKPEAEEYTVAKAKLKRKDFHEGHQGNQYNQSDR